jgi:hypothetical protein
VAFFLIELLGFPMVALQRAINPLTTSRERKFAMTTIIILNAISSLVAAAGVGALAARRRRNGRKVLVRPLYVDKSGGRARPRG